MTREACGRIIASSVALAVAFAAAPAAGQSVLTTPVTPMELPIEVEIELSPAGSLKQALLWKELLQLLENPGAYTCPPDDPATEFTNESYYCTAQILRRPSFRGAGDGVAMPDVNIYSPAYNFLTGQPLRLRTSDGEVSWDQPGPLFDPGENVAPDAFSTPTQLRERIGHLIACPNDPPYQAAVGDANGEVPGSFCTGKPDGSLVVFNNSGSTLIPPNGTVVAVAAIVNGALQELAAESTTVTVDREELEIPVNEEDFFRPVADTAGVPAPLSGYIGRRGAEVLGKALFWDMQVGSDSVQACASCHFNAGADNRTRNQLNPNTLGGDLTLNVASAAALGTTNVDVVASDFPFHRSGQDDLTDDVNDVMSSMGVSRFKRFFDIPAIGTRLAAVNGVAALPPDRACGDAGVPTCLCGAPPAPCSLFDPIEVMSGVRRVEPRNTPTFHGAAFNFDNFWDGRARFIFNGGSVFGPSDPTAHVFIDPGNPQGPPGQGLQGANMGHIRPDLIAEEPEVAEQPVRIKFSSLGSQSVGPPLSDFEMSFAGRNHAKIGKKMLQNGVVPLANQLVATDDSRLGPFSNQGGAICGLLTPPRPTAVGKPGLCVSYNELIELAFERHYWHTVGQRLNGCYTDDGDPDTFQNTPVCPAGTTHDPFDGYVLAVANGAAAPNNTNQFRQREANFSLFFALSVQAYEALTIPDDTPADRFFDANPNAGHGVGEPGDQAVLFPTLIPDLLDDGQLNGTNGGFVTTIPDDPSTPWYDGFGPDEVFGFDIFAGANLTAGLRPQDAIDPRSGTNRNPEITNNAPGGVQTIRVGSNPFTRSAKCMLCHLGPEQTDHSINIAHGLLKNDAEFEFPNPPAVPDPTSPATFPPEIDGPFVGQSILPSPEPSGSSRTVVGLILEEEVGEGVAQDAVEVEPRDFQVLDDPATPWDDRIVAQESNFAFGDQGVYNIGVRPIDNDIGRGGDDPFGMPLSLAALTLKNIGGQDFEPCDDSSGSCVMGNFDPFDIGATFEETGGGVSYPGTTHDLQSINPGFERDPMVPQLPEYLAPWVNSLPAGELHPQIDEMAGMVPNTITPPNGGPGIEFPEVLFGADFHCAAYDPAVYGMGPPNFGWGPPDSTERLCPQTQSGVAGNFAFPSQGTWPVPNRVMREGAFKAPPLRNVELTGPYFHTGSYLTLRQVVDFYVRGGDFPVTNKESRDPHVVNLDMQAFAFGPSQGTFGGFNLLNQFDCSAEAPNIDGVTPVGCGDFSYLIGSFGDGLPDTPYLYDAMPDTDHAISPEYASAEDAKTALVKFLIALTDPRVKLERAPFDHPQLFVPIDGAAPDNTGGPTQLAAQSGVPCPVPGPNPGPVCFRNIAAVGAGGLPVAAAVPAFLGVTSIPPGGAGFNCSAASGPVSHFCSTISP